MSTLVNVTAAELRAELEAGTITLVDVREPHEFAARRIPGSVNQPLSSFDPAQLPEETGKSIVFMCAGGVRSAKAVAAAMAAGHPWNRHLEGGIQAWMQAGQPTE